MKPKTSQKPAALTILEVLIILVAIAGLATLLLPQRNISKGYSTRIYCVNNLKQVGVAYRVWANDNGDKFPALTLTTATNGGGWQELLANQNQGALCWTNYAIMQNELGQSPRVIVCPSDERQPATSFSNINNANISYFVGVGADDNHPEAILGGDRNLGRGLTPDPDYGFSPANGKGNDVAIQTNSSADPVSWSLNIHAKGNTAGAGNILLGDASVQQATSYSFRIHYQQNAIDAGNWPSNHIPAVPSFRLIFP